MGVPMNHLLKTAPILLCFLLTNCRSIGDSPSNTKALVTPEQFGTAIQVLGDLPTYIPFNEPGICFARALYMSMALASKEIPSSAYFVFPKQPGQTLNGINGMPWQYHVSMMIRANDSHEQMVFDPAFSEQPMVDSKWISLMSQEEVKTVIVPGSQYAQEILRGANIPPRFINSFEELPPFKL
jgi:hypothetical protein